MTTLILGLDGAGFELVDPWLEDLPALRRMTEDGVRVDMESCFPPVTCPNWRCYSTGKNPGKLGVFWWEWVDRENERIVNTSASDQFDGTDYWEWLDDEVAVVNLPTSYPPIPLDGINVTGGPGAEQTGYTHPPDLEAQLERDYDYKVHPEKLFQLDKDDADIECIDEIYDVVDRRFDLIADLVASGEYEFVHLTVFYLNMLQHFYYDHDIVKVAWERIDDRLAELLESDELDHIFVMSDHGSNRVEHWFRVNALLEREGYLVTTASVSDLLYRTGLTRERIRSAIGALGLEWWARRVVPDSLTDLLPDREGTVDRSAKANHIDWAASTAVASGQGPVYVLADDPAERERIRTELVDLFDGLCDDDGNRIIQAAYPAEKVYEGPHVERGPDVLLDQAPNVHIDGGIGDETAFDEPQKWHGENKRTGLFVAHGPTVDADGTVADMSILDIAPTILHLHGQAVPEDLDGTVRTELFAEGTDPTTRPVEHTTPPADASAARDDNGNGEDVRTRLKNLGYLE